MKMSSKILFITLLLCVFIPGSSVSGESFTFTRNLTLGISGNDVSTLQQFLIAGGFLKIPIPTGLFGPITKTAVGAWQASAGIYPSAGFFGLVSRGKIDIALGNSENGLPVRLKIPKLNIDAGFQYTGLKSDGTMEIPSNIVDAGWFTGSTRPGGKGTAIITGHVAQIRGGVMTKQGVFYDLNELRVGDKLYVIDDKGASVAFVVRESRTYDPTADSTDVFTSTDGGTHLNLITCEGSWNSTKLSYTQRLVIFTDAVQ